MYRGDSVELSPEHRISSNPEADATQVAFADGVSKSGVRVLAPPLPDASMLLGRARLEEICK